MVTVNGIVTGRRATLVAMTAAVTSLGANVQQTSRDVQDEQIASRITDESTLTRSAINTATSMAVGENGAARLAIDTAILDGTTQKIIHGGRVPKPLRAPVLAIEQAWPDRNTDHRILWAEESGQTLYALGYDTGFRKSTDGGLTWTLRGLQGFGAAETGAFLKTPTGTLLMMRPGSTAAIQRSTDDGATWASVFNSTTTPASRLSTWAMGAQSWAVDPITGFIYYGEYVTSNYKPDLRIYRSEDDGATWPVWYSFPGFVSLSADKVRHVHSVQWDHVAQRIVIMTGDSDPAAGLYRVNAAGTGVEPLLLNRQVPDIQDAGRAIGIIPFPDFICWTGDSSGNPYLMRMARSEIGKANPVVERLYRLNSTGWFTIRASADGSRWVFSASPENASVRIDRSVHLYAVEDQGEMVYELGALAIKPGTGGLPAVAPVGQAEIHGDVFFLQTHSAGRHAVWKATLAQGTCQLPWPQDRPTVYAWQTASSGAVDLESVSGKNSQVFGHAKVPFTAKRLHIFDLGCQGQTGATGDLRLRVKKKADGMVLLSSYVPSERLKRRLDTGGPIESFTLSFNDDIEFEVYTAFGALRGTAFVTYGFGT